MIIYMYDGSELECNSIEISGDILCADGYRLVNVCDVDRIETA